MSDDTPGEDLPYEPLTETYHEREDRLYDARGGLYEEEEE